MKRYWRVKNDLWTPSRSINSFGCIWNEFNFYPEHTGAIGPTTYSRECSDFRWAEDDAHLEKPSFNTMFGGFLLACSVETFAHFQELLADQILIWEDEVSGEAHVGFRPKAMLDLMDEDRTTFHVLPSGTKNNFRNVTLTHAPDADIDFFGLAGGFPQNLVQIVSDDFKDIYESEGMTGLVFHQAYPAVSLT